METKTRSNIDVSPVQASRLKEVDFDALPFGRIFSDHMLIARYSEGTWQKAEIVPYGPLPFFPSLMALNYGQSIFEGLKAYQGIDNKVILFRAEDNWKRLNRSAVRMSMPEVPESIFMDGLKALIDLDRQWVPTQEQGALYIRPLYFATDEFIGVKSSDTYIFVLFTSPVGPYYSKPVNLLVTRDYVRAATGGTGAAKTAGNYAASLLPDQLAKAKGYDNMLWLDARELKYVEECGTMNVFFVIDDTVITPALSGTILPGITRNSVIHLLKDHGYKVESRQIAIEEIHEAYAEGSLREAFGTGTAATIAHIAKIGYAGLDMMLPPVEERKVGNWLNETLNDIKSGAAPDPYGWITKV